MAENINKPRSIDIILDELFVGKKSAFEAMSRVRHAQYEVNLWRHGIRSRKSAREYFEKRYLGGIKLKDATEEQLTDALKSLRYAVGKDLGKPTGCYERCLKLVNELNRAIIAERLGSTVAVDGFIDYFTFYPCEPVSRSPNGIMHLLKLIKVLRMRITGRNLGLRLSMLGRSIGKLVRGKFLNY